jgi:hypothetical protein
VIIEIAHLRIVLAAYGPGGERLSIIRLSVSWDDICGLEFAVGAMGFGVAVVLSKVRFPLSRSLHAVPRADLQVWRKA